MDNENENLEMSTFEDIDNLVNLDSDNEDDEDVDGGPGVLLVKSRLKKLIKSVAVSENFAQIEAGDKAIQAFQDSMRYLNVMLTYEVIEVLKTKSRVRVTPEIVNIALTKMLGRSDAVGIAVTELDSLVDKLSQINSQTSIAKAMDFVNIIEKAHDEGDLTS
jgi:hypothetical protein